MNSHRETFAERVLAARSRRIAQEQAEFQAEKRRKLWVEVRGWMIGVGVFIFVLAMFRAMFVLIDMGVQKETSVPIQMRIPWWPSAPRPLRQI